MTEKWKELIRHDFNNKRFKLFKARKAGNIYIENLMYDEIIRIVDGLKSEGYEIVWDDELEYAIDIRKLKGRGMRKKVEDCTIEELRRFCRTIEECEGNCPLFGWSSYDVCCSMYPPSELEPDVLEKEIEIPEEAE